MPGRKSKYIDITRKSDIADVIQPETKVTHTLTHPRRYCRSYGSWEYSYFKYLIVLRNIFIRGIVQLYPEMEEYLYSTDFMKVFCKMVYDCSSTHISEFLETLSDELKEDYHFYSTQTTF